MKRDIVKVIKKMREHIPDGHVLHARLQSVQNSVPYMPPEAQHELWARARWALVTEIGEPTQDWEIKVNEIFEGKVELNRLLAAAYAYAESDEGDVASMIELHTAALVWHGKQPPPADKAAKPPVPASQTLAELREIVGDAYDGVDAIEFVRQVRGGQPEAPTPESIRALAEWFDSDEALYIPLENVKGSTTPGYLLRRIADGMEGARQG